MEEKNEGWSHPADTFATGNDGGVGGDLDTGTDSNTGDYAMNTNTADGDTFTLRSNRSQPLVEMRQAELVLAGYDTESDEVAHIACSECGERIEWVQKGYGGGVCGCRETPKKWKMEALDV